MSMLSLRDDITGSEAIMSLDHQLFYYLHFGGILKRRVLRFRKVSAEMGGIVIPMTDGSIMGAQ